jgi:hypothetical protein
VAVKGTIAKGLDLDYPTHHLGGAGVKAGGYYLSAVDAGEPPGRWWGPMCEHLGIISGSDVDVDVYRQVFGRRQAPDGTKLGRAPGNGATRAHEIYQRLLAAEPGADASRRRQLRMDAQRLARQSPYYYDATMSPSKSISVFHASLGENLRQATLRGDEQGAARWSRAIEDMDAAIYAANKVFLAYLQTHAGFVRRGTHAGRVNGRETGKWLPADLMSASWYQHTSRDGDPQLHVHNTILHAAWTRDDAKVRAPDNNLYYRHVAAAASLAAVHLETWMSQQFGLEWVERADGLGHEIKGIAQAVMDAFSSRRHDIDRHLADTLIPQFRAAYGREPSQAELSSLRQTANLSTRKPKPDAPDADDVRAAWAAKLTRLAGADLASLARVLMRDADDARTSAPTDAEIAAAAGRALRQASRKATWTRSDLVTTVGRVLPVARDASPAARAALVEQIADRALAGEFGAVTCLEAPDLLTVPADLIREDGRSVYQTPHAARYATRSQLSVEERLVKLAAEDGGPALDPEYVAAQLGTDAATLRAALSGEIEHSDRVLTRSGLRLDQAAAVFHATTTSRRVVVINAPAGAGKTTAAAVVARIAEGAGLAVIGVTPSQVSRNTLAERIPRSYNFAQFLGHLPGRRGVRGPVDFPAWSVIVVDEASMLSSPDMLDVEALAAKRDATVLLLGDTEQLAAVEHGGSMRLVVADLGFAQLDEPVRFRQQWERDASLRLRQGEVSVLDEYATRGRLRAGPLEETLEAAASLYMARTLEGHDTLLVVQDHATRRELSRRIRGELRHLGLVSSGRTAAIADGQHVSAGDLVMCTKNDNGQDAGDGETLSNKHLLEVVDVTADGLTLRRLLDADPDTGERRYSGHVFTYADTSRFELGYAVTQHCAQSRTVRTCIGVFTGGEARQGAYVALSRGTDENIACIATPSPRLADPLPVQRTAPEIARQRMLDAERHGQRIPPASADLLDEAGPAIGDENLIAGIGVLSGVLERDGAELSALEYQRQQLSDADHLAILNEMWEDQTWQATASRYRQIVTASLLPEYHADLDTPQARWLYRTLRAAELAGMDPGDVVQHAASQSGLEHSRNAASVLDWRIRQAIGAAVPLPSLPWSDQVPDMLTPEHQAFADGIAAAMDDRAERIGEHATDAGLPLYADALGTVPDDPVDRLEWQRRAKAIGVYREMHRWEHPADPIGPEPTAAESPDKRQRWYDAFRALGPVPGTDVRGQPDSSLWHMRGTYEAETALAPRYVAPVLGMVRQAAADAAAAAVRADAEARRAATHGQTARAQRHQARAAEQRRRQGLYAAQGRILALADEQWREYRAATDAQRSLAIAADTELRRRHPGLKMPPLADAGPSPVSTTERAESARPDRIPDWVERLAQAGRDFEERMQQWQNLRVPHEDPDYEPLGEAFPLGQRRYRDAILQPPRPQMPPAARLREAQREAG